MNIVVGGSTLPQPKLPFTIPHNEQAADNVTLDGTLYTDFTSQRREHKMQWERMTLAEYNLLRAQYDLQFTTNTYPTLVITELGINTTARISMNAKDIIYDGDCVRKVKATFKEKSAV